MICFYLLHVHFQTGYQLNACQYFLNFYPNNGRAAVKIFFFLQKKLFGSISEASHYLPSYIYFLNFQEEYYFSLFLLCDNVQDQTMVGREINT